MGIQRLVKERKQSKQTDIYDESSSDLEFDDSPDSETYLTLPTIRKERERSSPMFTFKDISKVAAKPVLRSHQPSLRNLLPRKSQVEQMRVLSDHTRTSSALSTTSDRAHETITQIDRDVKACRGVQQKYQTARRNIHLQVEKQAKEAKVEVREDYFSTKNALEGLPPFSSNVLAAYMKQKRAAVSANTSLERQEPL